MTERNLTASSNDDQVQQFQLFGQGSSSHQPEQFTTDAESLDPLMVRRLMQESGLTSEIMADQPEQFTTDAESLDTLMVRRRLLQ